ncbi:hypothetical protein LPW36_02180 [Jinshanibacter sp. LJY008]|uniref:Bro-N domain-containing protein n=1 Tax=Limnobaculum eriocheiris TaxID=2897391 RepID=A0A9X1MUH0_9GAMM|nr:BRO family protein [Limnobaculum eriocheiris]MCD1124853.1 hypothetical protein [Limnobaculum eriocheiris]
MTNSDVIQFHFENTPIRVTYIDGKPWLVANDVCKALRLNDTIKTTARVDDDERRQRLLATTSGIQSMNIVSVSGVYTMVLRCRDVLKTGSLEHRFKRWFTNELIPKLTHSEQAVYTPVDTVSTERVDSSFNVPLPACQILLTVDKHGVTSSRVLKKNELVGSLDTFFHLTKKAGYIVTSREDVAKILGSL